MLANSSFVTLHDPPSLPSFLGVFSHGCAGIDDTHVTPCDLPPTRTCSGGIGVTPMQSVLNDLLSQYSRGRAIEFLW